MSMPTERQAINGRTWSASWQREHFNPITFYPSPWSGIWRAIVCVAAAGAIGAMLALAI